MQMLKQFARNLRNNPTDAEKHLWRHLKSRQLNGIKFRRQVSIDRYIADFVSFEKRIIVEIDGGQHTPEKDGDRAAFLESKGFVVLRFWNNDVLTNIDGVLERISEAIKISSS